MARHRLRRRLGLGGTNALYGAGDGSAKGGHYRAMALRINR